MYFPARKAILNECVGGNHWHGAHGTGFVGETRLMIGCYTRIGNGQRDRRVGWGSRGGVGGVRSEGGAAGVGGDEGEGPSHRPAATYGRRCGRKLGRQRARADTTHSCFWDTTGLQMQTRVQGSLTEGSTGGLENCPGAQRPTKGSARWMLRDVTVKDSYTVR